MINIKRTCKCGKVGGKYTDDLNAIYFGENAIPLGFENSSLAKAVKTQPKNGMRENFNAFVIPKVCSTYKLVLECELMTYAKLV